ncbi:MAG: inositol phosphorylceramide synthase [Dehalococcoidia bacterium]|nr:inositol phosphorylceramide synthase [Dehalococcoidia bacterium]
MSANVGQTLALEGRPHLRTTGAGLRLATRTLTIRFVLPYVALLVIHAGLEALPPALGRTLAIAGPALVMLALWRRGSAYALWPGYLLFLQVHATIWAMLPTLGVPVQVGYVVVLDRVLGLGQLPTLLLQEATGATPALGMAAFGVYASFFVAPVFVFLAAWHADRAVAAAFTRAMTVASFASLVVMAAVPTAPPWMAAAEGAIPPIERIAERVAGPAVHSAAEDIIGINEVAAMPSLHTAATVLVALVVIALVPRTRRWIWLYPFAMALSLVYLGEHYAADTIAGLAVALVAWRLAWSARGPFAPQRYRAAEDAGR